MNQQELEELLRQIAPNNDPGRLTFTEDTATVEREEPGPYVGADPVKKKVPVKVLTWVDRGTGQTLVVHANPDGTYTKQSQGVDPKMQGEPATTPAQTAKDELGTEIATRQETDAQGKTVKVTTYRRPDGSTYDRTDVVQAAPEKPQTIAGTLNTTSPQYAVIAPDGSVTWHPNPNYRNPSPKPIDLPNTRTITWDNGDGTTTTQKNPSYVKPSKIIPNPSDPRKMVNVTEDDNGNPVILPVDDKTTIKPADLPVLQSKYGEIAQGLGQLAQDLNSRVARGEITPQERTEAFTAAHAQASTQVAEINSILENSKAIWSGQVAQRRDTLGETQSRRSFADSMANRAMATGASVAAHSGKGSGAAIASGVEALMRMGQRYAEGMGGFKDSPEVGLPPALQQAQGISLPGYGPTAGAPPSPPPPPSGANVDATNAAAMAGSRAAFGGLGIPPVGAPAAAPPQPVSPSGISNTTDAGGVPREYSPASSTVGSGLPPGVAGMGAALGAAQGYAGGPVAGGDAGMWDPTHAVQGMLGDGSDPAWAEAVRRAAAGFGR